MLTVQNYNAANSSIAFKQNENTEKEAQTTSAPIPAYKTNAGYGVSATHAGATLASLALLKPMMKISQKFIEKESVDAATKARLLEDGLQSFKVSKITGPLTIIAALASGAIVNHAINKKNKEFANQLQEKGKVATLRENQNAELTKNDNPYYRSTTGRKLGTLLGAGLLPTITATSHAICKIKAPKLVYGVSALTGALGGFVLGGITDYINNKGAKKHADKTASVEQ